jgi:hypothetical protein
VEGINLIKLVCLEMLQGKVEELAQENDKLEHKVRI